MLVALIITHAVISLALIIIVLLQQGKQQGLSGAIAGGAETFFGKNKARTIDSMLKKFTTVVAALFIINSIGLYFVMAQNATTPVIPPPTQGDFEMNEMGSVEMGWFVGEDGRTLYHESAELDENEMPIEGTEYYAPVGLYLGEDGVSIVDADGNVEDGLYYANGEVWFDLSQIMPMEMPTVGPDGTVENVDTPGEYE